MRAWAVLGLVLGLLLVAGCPKPGGGTGAGGTTGGAGSAEPIKIGEYGSLTGPTATFGQSTHRGIELAVTEINGAGGVLDRQLQVITEDNAGKTEETAAAVQKLITRDQVAAVLGEVASSRSIVGGNICEDNQIPMITPSSTNPKVTEGKRWVTRVCFIDTFQGEALAKFCRETLGASAAAILKDRKNEYSVGLAEFFDQTFTSMGGQIVADENYNEGDIDFKPVLTKIKAANPDVIFVPGYYTECGLIVKQARGELGMTQPIVGGDGWDADELISTIKGDLEGDGVYFGTHFSPGEERPEVQNFVQKYTAEYNMAPDAMAALGYDAARLLADAIERAGSLDAEALQKAIDETSGFAGVTGQITIDENHNARKPMVVLEVTGGQRTVAASVPPSA